MKKITKNLKNYFFDDKPLFGLDIGHYMLRVMQLDAAHKLPKVKGYGSIAFDPSAIVEGVIVKPELIAKAALKLFNSGLVGDISTNRAAVSLPASRALTCAVRIPRMNVKDIDEAVRTAAEQYIPISTDNLYLDYTTIREDDKGTEVFVVSIPKKIVDSYLVLTRMMGLEAVLLDTAIGASARLFTQDKRSEFPSVLIDFGADSTDITVFSHGLVVTGTVVFGSDDITKSIAKTLRITPHEATMTKGEYGLSLSSVQHQILKALEPSLELLIKEIRRNIRYYEQRYIKEPPIGQILTMGGGANMPGLADYLTSELRLPARTFDPTPYIDFGHLRPFYNADRMSYVTVSGLALTNPVGIFQ